MQSVIGQFSRNPRAPKFHVENSFLRSWKNYKLMRWEKYGLPVVRVLTPKLKYVFNFAKDRITLLKAEEITEKLNTLLSNWVDFSYLPKGNSMILQFSSIMGHTCPRSKLAEYYLNTKHVIPVLCKGIEKPLKNKKCVL